MHTPGIEAGTAPGEWLTYCVECSQEAGDWVDHAGDDGNFPGWPPHVLVGKDAATVTVTDEVTVSAQLRELCDTAARHAHPGHVQMVAIGQLRALLDGASYSGYVQAEVPTD